MVGGKKEELGITDTSATIVLYGLAQQSKHVRSRFSVPRQRMFKIMPG